MAHPSPQDFHRCFCELAPLYAIGVLNESDRAWVDMQAANCPDLAEELATYQATAAMIPYSLPEIGMAPDLKTRLFQRVTGDVNPLVPPSDELNLEQSSGTAVRAEQLDWQPDTVPGLEIARLHLDSAKREMTCLIRAKAGAQYPPHRHGGVEEIMMLEGALVMAGQTFHKGDYLRSESGSIHPFASTPMGCMFFLRTSIDNQRLEA